MSEVRADEPLGRLLDRVADQAPTPGSGAVCALTVAGAAAVLAMVGRGSQADPEVAAGLVAQADSIRRRALGLAETITEAYAAAIGAREGPADAVRLGEAFDRAASVPLEVAARASDASALAEELASRGDPRRVADAAAAGALAAGAARAAAVLVRVNLSMRPQDERIAEADRLAGAADAAARNAMRMLL
jgi:methenyltetrahydrofolate cyclohydrolase